MRRAAQLGQNPRRLQLKATSRSAWHSVQRVWVGLTVGLFVAATLLAWRWVAIRPGRS